MELRCSEVEESPSLFARSLFRDGLNPIELQMLPVIRILLRPVPVKRRTPQQHQRHRRRYRHEDADEDFVEGEAVAGDGEIDDRGHDDAAGAPAGAECGRMQALIEAVELGKADGADQRQRGAQKDEERHQNGGPERKFCGIVHSITSPRIMNLERATVETKPRIAMSSEASK